MIRRAILGTLLGLLLLSGYASAINNYFVSPSGSGSTCSQASPCSITTVDSVVVVGTAGTCTAGSSWSSQGGVGACIHVASGNYTADISTSKAGTPSARIRYISDTQYGARLLGNSSAVVWASHGLYTDIFGFDFDGSVNSVTADGVIFYAGQGWIFGNRFHDFGLAGGQRLGSVAEDGPNGGCSTGSNRYENNLFYHINGGGSSTFNDGSGNGAMSVGACAVVRNNLVLDVGGGWCIQDTHASTNTIVTNNTFLFCARGGIRLSNNTGGSNDFTTVTNNIFANMPSNGFGTGGIFVDPTACTVNNIFANNLMYGNNINFTGGGCTQSGLQTGSNSTTFVNYTGAITGDYHPKAGSTAIGNGTTACALTGCVPPADFAGNVQTIPPVIGYLIATPGGVPIVNFSPSPLAFGSVAVSTPVTLTETLQNTGSANLVFNPATIAGLNAADYVIVSTTCVSPLPASASCVYSIRFTPSAAGARSASLTLNDNAAGSPHQVPLTGSGGTAGVTLNPTSLSFGTITPGSCSAPQTSSITSTGTQPLIITSGFIFSDPSFQFGTGGNCSVGQSLSPGQSCQVAPKFCPTVAGVVNGNMTVPTNAPSSPNLLLLTGTGGSSTATLTPATFNFGNQQIGTGSLTQNFTFTNTGSLGLSGIAVSITGSSTAYSQTNNCGTTLAVGLSCTIGVVFKPLVVGTLNASLLVASSAAGSPATSTLSGTGIAANIVLNPTSSNFGQVLVGNTASVAVTVTNNGTAAAQISGVSTAAPFSQTNNCPAILNPAAVCTVNVTFTPTATGLVSGQLVVADNAPGNPHTAALSGTGTAPAVSFSPASNSYGNQAVGTASSPATFTFSNTGSGPVQIFAVNVTGTNPGDFLIGTNTCGATPTLQDTFATGTLDPAKWVIDTGPSPAQGANNTGTFVTGNVSLAQGLLELILTQAAGSPIISNGAEVRSVNRFGYGTYTWVARTGSTSSTPGGAGAAVSGQVTGLFNYFQDAGLTAPNFTEDDFEVEGQFPTQLELTSWTSASPKVNTFTSFTASMDGGLHQYTYVWAPGRIDYYFDGNLVSTHTTNVPTNPAYIIQNFYGTNATAFGGLATTGSTRHLYISSFSYTPSSSTLAAGQSCTVGVAFKPTSSGARSASLSISDSASGSPHTAALTGTGTTLTVTLLPNPVSFPNTVINVTSSPIVSTLTNTGNITLNIASKVATGDFAISSSTCASTLAASASCAISLTFTPTATGVRNGALTVTDNANGSPQSIVLTGTGTAPTAPIVSLSPTSLSFGNQVINTLSSAQVVTLTNTGNATLNMTRSITGDYSISATTCGATLAALASCTVSVKFQPTALGSRTGNLIFTDDAAGSPQNVPLTGTGVSAPAPIASISPVSLTFTSQTVGTTSAAQNLTLTNTGNATLNIASILAAGDFAISANTCGPTLAATVSCTVSVTFTPTTTGTRSGTIQFTDDASGSPQTIPLTGTGTAPTAPIVSLSPTSINFGSFPLGTTTNIAATSTGWSNCITVACAGGVVDATSATQTFGASSLLTVVGPPHSNALFFYKLNGSSRNGVTSWLDDIIVNIGSSGASAQAFEYDIAQFILGQAYVYGTECSQGFGFWRVWNESAQAWVSTPLACSLSVSTDHHIVWSFSRSGSNMVYNSVTIDGVLHPINMTEPSGPRPTFTDAVADNVQLDIGGAGTTLTETIKNVNIWANPQTITLTNTGNATLNIASITASGDFSVPVTTCGSTLAASASCTITIGFAPSAVGTRNGTLTITDNAAGSPHTVSLIGVGTNATSPVASISPTSLSFGNQVINTSSSTQAVTLTNTGTAVLNNTSITSTGDFTVLSTTCTSTLAVGASCVENVRFTPSALGTRNGTLVFTNNASGSPQTVTLTGSGVPAPQPALTLSPASLTFPSTFVAATSPTQDITATNTGNAVLNIASIVATGDYAKTTTCGPTLAAAASCLVHVTFTPTAPGVRSGAITFTDDASGSPQAVSLTGVGIATAPAVCLNPNSFNFGNIPVGSTSGSNPFVVTNCGTANLIVTSVTPMGDFTETNTCGTVTPGSTCAIQGKFAPTVAGARTGQFSIADNAADTPQIISLSGFGTQAGATLTPTTVNFGTVVVGQLSNATTLTLANVGNVTLIVNTPTFTGTNPTDFSFTGNCGPNLAVNASCTYAVRATPGGAGSRTGTFNQTFGNGVAPNTVALSVTGQATAPAVTLSPTTINFGSVTVGTPSTTQVIQLTNSGTANLLVTLVNATGTNLADVGISADHCTGATVIPGAVCTVSVTMTPGALGTRTANANFVTNAASSPDTVPLQVIGLAAPAPQATFTPTTLAFGNIKTGTTSGAQNVTVGNIGNANLVVGSVTLAGVNPSQYTQTNTCGTIAPNGNCSITVNFAPTVTGSLPASLIIASNDPTSPSKTITLTGSGKGHPKARIAASTINFGNQTVGTISGPAVFTITNVGDATLNVSPITTTGDTFPQINSCDCCPVAPGASCSVSVQFNPQTLCGQFDINQNCISDVHLGQVNIVSDGDGSPQSVGLQGLALPIPPPPGPITVTMGGHLVVGGKLVVGVQ